MSSQPARLFTVEEATALLPELDRLLATAQGLLARVEESQRRHAGAAQTNGHVQRNGSSAGSAVPGTPSTEQQVRRILQQIQQQGVVVRDLRIGLIDFPSLRGGDEVYLCWQRGEPLRIEWWHPISTGIAGRERL